MRFFLGVDVGGSKSHALIADETGQSCGFGAGGPGNWEVVGFSGLSSVLQGITAQALEMAQINIEQICGAGMGIGGYDWPCQREEHLHAIAKVGLPCPVNIANDAALGIWAGTEEGWGISIVAGSGCNARGISRDHSREGRMVGGNEHWSGEWVGGYGVVHKAMQAVAYEWNRRGPKTALSQAFIQRFGARDLFDLVEGVYLQRYEFSQHDALLVFRVAAEGDSAAIEVVRAAGKELGEMACGTIRQVGLETEQFDVVLIGSLHDGHPLMADTMRETIQAVAPGARLVRLSVPPVVGGVLFGMNAAGFHPQTGVRERLIRSFAKQD
jgi:N-acetylglucosamine kinase-like BadF-type ATPase